MINTAPQVAKGGFYSSKETAQILKISPITLYRHTLAGHIEAGLDVISNRKEYTSESILRYWKKRHSKLH